MKKERVMAEIRRRHHCHLGPDDLLYSVNKRDAVCFIVWTGSVAVDRDAKRLSAFLKVIHPAIRRDFERSINKNVVIWHLESRLGLRHRESADDFPALRSVNCQRDRVRFMSGHIHEYRGTVDAPMRSIELRE